MRLSQHILSLDYEQLTKVLVNEENLLIIQDLDGVCMPLVQDPMTRLIDFRFLQAAKVMAGHFYVLTNGEFIGSRGVNAIVERTVQRLGLLEKPDAFYLQGLGAGGVQWQNSNGNVSHPGVSERELVFMRSIPKKAYDYLFTLLVGAPFDLETQEVRILLQSAVLTNLVSPTINANVLHRRFCGELALYRELQRRLDHFMTSLLEEAAVNGLADSFFVHYAPNLGRDHYGRERIKPALDGDAGTTDYQFLLTGAIKEVGILTLLNFYYYQRTGRFPLGEHFNARNAPREHSALLQLAIDHFDPGQMPRIVGIGDTVTSSESGESDSSVEMLRGGSDRGFLTLVQELGKTFQVDNAVIFVDSSGGEICRPGLNTEYLRQAWESTSLDPWPGVHGISDRDDSLRLNFVFPAGYEQYVAFFLQLAARYRRRHPDHQKGDRRNKGHTSKHQ